MSNMRLSQDEFRISEELVNVVRVKSKETKTIAVLGDKGSGKTLLMAILSLVLHISGFDFYTNFWMDERIYSRKDFSISNMYQNPNTGGIFLDECHNVADQNSNRTSETQLLVALFSQSRKRGQLIVLSTLHMYKLAKDLRFLTDLIAYPVLDEKRDLLKVVFWDLTINKKTTAYIPNVSRFFKYYDTYEIIVSDRIKNQLTSYLLSNEKLQTEIKKKLQTKDQKILTDMKVNLKNERNNKLQKRKNKKSEKSTT